MDVLPATIVFFWINLCCASAVIYCNVRHNPNELIRHYPLERKLGQPPRHLGGCVYECRLSGSVLPRHDLPVCATSSHLPVSAIYDNVKMADNQKYCTSSIQMALCSTVHYLLEQAFVHNSISNMHRKKALPFVTPNQCEKLLKKYNQTNNIKKH